jgi:hypothetical protein
MIRHRTVHTAVRYAAGAVFMFSPHAAASRMPPRPDDTSRTPVVVERVEVPVPVDDTAAEVVQMNLAAALAAVVAAAVTKARLRRRFEHSAPSAVIDITDPRVLDRRNDEATAVR